MAEYKDGRGNISRGRGGISFHGRGLSIRGLVLRIILESVLIAIEPITLLNDVESYRANLPDLL